MSRANCQGEIQQPCGNSANQAEQTLLCLFVFLL